MRTHIMAHTPFDKNSDLESSCFSIPQYSPPPHCWPSPNYNPMGVFGDEYSICSPNSLLTTAVLKIFVKKVYSSEVLLHIAPIRIISPFVMPFHLSAQGTAS